MLLYFIVPGTELYSKPVYVVAGFATYDEADKAVKRGQVIRVGNKRHGDIFYPLTASTHPIATPLPKHLSQRKHAATSFIPSSNPNTDTPSDPRLPQLQTHGA